MVDLDLVYRNRNVWKAQELCNWCGGNWNMEYFICGVSVTVIIGVFLIIRFYVPIPRIDGAVRARTQELNAQNQDLTQKLDNSLKANYRLLEDLKTLEREQDEVRKVEDEAEVQFQAYVRELEALKEHEPWRITLPYLEKHAATYKNELLKRRTAIRQEDSLFRSYWVPILQEQRPDLVPFGEWERKALAIAEQLDVEMQGKPRRTFEEVRAKAVRYLQEKNSDLIAETVAIAEDIETSCSALDHLNLDPEIKQQLVQELVDRIVNKESANGNTNKKLV